MTDSRTIRILEMNEEFLSISQSKEYKLGKILYGKNKTKMLWDIGMSYLRLKKYANHNVYEIKKKTNYRNEKIAIYTVMFGAYDEIEEPILIENCDYFIITDQEIPSNSIWKKFDVSNYNSVLVNMTNVEKNRFFKMNCEILNTYDYVIYIDSNIRIVAGMQGLIEYVNPTTGIAIHNHPSRDCLFDELQACMILKKVKDKTGKNQIKRYQSEGMPHHFGLYECCVIVRDTKNPVANNLMNQWWHEFKGSETKRDQLCLPYILWKNGYKYEDIGLLGNNVNKNACFRRNIHL